MSSSKQNKFLKNETLFQTLYRINKQVKGNTNPNTNNLNTNNINENFKKENTDFRKMNMLKQIKTDANELCVDNLNTKRNYNNVDEYVKSGYVCSCPKNDDESKNTHHSEHCVICNYSLNENIERNNYKLYRDNPEGYLKSCTTESKNTLNCSTSNDDSASHQSSYQPSYQSGTSYTTSNPSCISCQSNVPLKISNQTTMLNSNNKYASHQSCVSSQPYSVYSAKSSNTQSIISSHCSNSQSHPVNNINLNQHNKSDCNTQSKDKYCVESISYATSNEYETNDTDDQSTLLIKIISNLEERLNSLETKKEKKHKKK